MILEAMFMVACCGRYENPDIALNCGMMLRECARNEDLARIMLNSNEFYQFFNYVEVSTFDIASDAFSTFKVSAIDFSPQQLTVAHPSTFS